MTRQLSSSLFTSCCWYSLCHVSWDRFSLTKHHKHRYYNDNEPDKNESLCCSSQVIICPRPSSKRICKRATVRYHTYSGSHNYKSQQYMHLITFFTKKRATGLEPVQAELNSAMLHQLHHARTIFGSMWKNTHS